jgi:hypothetical protein
MQPTTMRAFVRAIVSSWFTGMSGPISVPLATAAVFVPSNVAKVGLGITALACFWGAAYGVWARERRVRNGLESTIAQHAFGVRFSFGPSLDRQNPNNTLEIRTFIQNVSPLHLSYKVNEIIVKLSTRTVTLTSVGPLILHRGDTTTIFPNAGLTNDEYLAMGRMTTGTLRYNVSYGVTGTQFTRAAIGEVHLDVFKDQETGHISINWLFRSQEDKPI